MSEKEIGIKAVIRPQFDFKDISAKIRQGIKVPEVSEKQLSYKRALEKYSFQLPKGSPAESMFRKLQQGYGITEEEFNKINKAFKEIQLESLSAESKENKKQTKERLKEEAKQDKAKNKSLQKINSSFIEKFGGVMKGGALAMIGSFALNRFKESISYGLNLSEAATALNISGPEYSRFVSLLSRFALDKEAASKLAWHWEKQQREWITKGQGNINELATRYNLDRDMLARMNLEEYVKFGAKFMYKNFPNWNSAMQREFVKLYYGSLEAGFMEMAKISPAEMSKIKLPELKEENKEFYRKAQKGFTTYMNDLYSDTANAIPAIGEAGSAIGNAVWSDITKAIDYIKNEPENIIKNFNKSENNSQSQPVNITNYFNISGEVDTRDISNAATEGIVKGLQESDLMYRSGRVQQ